MVEKKIEDGEKPTMKMPECTETFMREYNGGGDAIIDLRYLFI